MSNAEVIDLLERALAILRPPATVEPPSESDWRFQRAAHLHLAHLERHGSLTIADSRRIRRELYPTDKEMRSTANFFGRRGENTMLYRNVKTGTRTKAGDPVEFNEHGRELAAAWRVLHVDQP